MPFTPKVAAGLTDHDHWFRTNMPYAIARIDKKVWLPINRDYKPLGMAKTESHARYDQYRDKAITFSSDPTTFEGIFISGDADTLWLYNDGTESRRDYMERLERLLSKAKVSTKR